MTSRLDELNKKLQQNTNQGLASSSSSSSSRSSLKPPTSSSSLRPPPTMGSNRANQRKKVILQPGHSPLDWAQLNRTQPRHKLRGVPANTPPPQYISINKQELQKHKSLQDCWTCINGKVYNITPYINFHPGGVEEIMKCAGKDGTSLFNKYHSWVNVDRMLENCIVGVFHRD
ncbi:Cytochrome b5-like Heme/Steroid binding domain family protein [Candida albicans]|uniref:Cytochrome b5-like Heme/Steroid binding domain family protein n=1 Tax=Candida albicans TaxID=5476 RepID=A0A8H6F583_CANAX|nr:Cytochrome b5-like Heme/Steroid binding domain family protein [Candida albicans]